MRKVSSNPNHDISPVNSNLCSVETKCDSQDFEQGILKDIKCKGRARRGLATIAIANYAGFLQKFYQLLKEKLIFESISLASMVADFSEIDPKTEKPNNVAILTLINGALSTLSTIIPGISVIYDATDAFGVISGVLGFVDGVTALAEVDAAEDKLQHGFSTFAKISEDYATSMGSSLQYLETQYKTLIASKPAKGSDVSALRAALSHGNWVNSGFATAITLNDKMKATVAKYVRSSTISAIYIHQRVFIVRFKKIELPNPNRFTWDRCSDNDAPSHGFKEASYCAGGYSWLIVSGFKIFHPFINIHQFTATFQSSHFFSSMSKGIEHFFQKLLSIIGYTLTVDLLLCRCDGTGISTKSLCAARSDKAQPMKLSKSMASYVRTS